MLLKWIVCDVTESATDRFAQAQAKWSDLAGLDGFHAQIGGWNDRVPAQACVAALWDSVSCYEAFMAGAHDAIVRNNAQAGTYAAITVSLFEVIEELPGQCRSLADALRGAGVLRVADCTLRAGREEHFLEVQRSLWTPAIAQAEGMLGGVFSRGRGTDLRYLVASLWKGRENHAQYQANILPSLRAQAEVERDVERLEGHVVSLLQAWQVLPTVAQTGE